MTLQNRPGTALVPVSQLQVPVGLTLADIKRGMARKIIRTIYESLALGLGREEQTQCIEAVAHAFSFRDSENPGSISNSLLVLQAHLQTLVWSSLQARSTGLRRLALAALGTKHELNERAFLERLLRLAITRVPVALRAVASIHTNPTHQASLHAAADECEHNPVDESFMDAVKTAEDSAGDDPDSPLAVAAHLAGESAGYAVGAIVGIGSADKATVVFITNCALSAAHAQSTAAAIAANAVDPASADLRSDRVMAEYAESVVSILRELIPAGNSWLELVPIPLCELVADPGRTSSIQVDSSVPSHSTADQTPAIIS